MNQIRLTTREDLHLPVYSYSIVEAINTCPKWGIIRYKNRRYYKATARALALEAGSAMHEVFAALRLWQILRLQNLSEHFQFHGERLFGKERLDDCFQERVDPRDEAINFCFRILNSGEYYDDPTDRVRTMANMETTTIRYCDEQLPLADRNPIWIADPSDPTGLVGIEIPFDMVIDNELRYIGTIDGIVERDGIPRIEENKTASRLDEAWRESFRVKHQPTGYIAAARLVTGNEQISQAKIIGVRLKQAKSYEDYLSFVEDRYEDNIDGWIRTVMFAHKLASEYEATPLVAPEFTHSCNRYFRPCSFIDLCSAPMADQEYMYEGMDTLPLTPSESAIVQKWST